MYKKLRLFVILLIAVKRIQCVEFRSIVRRGEGEEQGTYHTMQCSAKHMEKALSSSEGCLPRATVIPLPWLNVSQSAQMTPTHVSVKRCEGGCHQFGHACLPTKIKMVRVPVMLAKCGINSGICDKECAAVELEEHTECSCSCQLTSADCRSADQDYRPDLCSCQCRDILARQNCLDAGRLWDDSSCRCGCRSGGDSEQSCAATGMDFDTASCSCIISNNSNNNSSLAAVTKADTQLTKHFPSAVEHWVILVLALIILLLLIFLVGLSLRIRTLTSRIRYHQGGDNSSTSDPLSDADLEVKQLNPGNVVYVEGSCSTPSSGFYSEIAAGERAGGVCGGGGVYKRESDSLYHSAESVRMKKQRSSPEEMRESAVESPSAAAAIVRSQPPPINIIENTLVGDEVFIRFKNMEDPYVPHAAAMAAAAATATPSLTYSTLRRGQLKPHPPPHLSSKDAVVQPVNSEYLRYDDTCEIPYDNSGSSGDRGVQYGSIKVARRPLVIDEDYRSLPRRAGGEPSGVDLSSYKSASHHIDEALRLLQESADDL